jgi:hypothetical protein
MEIATTRQIVIAAVGIGLAAVATFLHYLLANQAGHPGGYAALVLGSLGAGLLASACSYLAASTPARSVVRALVVGVASAAVFMATLTATLIWSFGS